MDKITYHTIQSNKYQPLLFVDFLGFSEKILDGDVTEGVRLYQTIIRDIGSAVSMTEGKMEFDIDNVHIDFISDSIIVWVESDDLKASTKRLFSIAQSLLDVSEMFKFERPLRGTIVFDNFIIAYDKIPYSLMPATPLGEYYHLILGKAIVNAYKWEQTQNWFGISVNPIYLSIFETELPGLLENLHKSKHICLYKVPTKKGEIETYCVCPYFTENANERLDLLLDNITDKTIMEKIINTKKYYDYLSSIYTKD